MQLLILAICIGGLSGKDKTWKIEGGAFVAEEQGDGRRALSSGNNMLNPGVYRVHLSYATGDDMINAWRVEADNLSFDGLLANACMLYSGLTETDMYFWLLQKTDSLRIQVICDESSEVEVYGAEIEETNLGARLFLTIFLTCFAIWDIQLFRREKRVVENAGGLVFPEKEMERRSVVFGMVVLILVSSVPLFTGYEIATADLNYHLQRIEGIKDALLAGQFPVRIHPNWLQGYGYVTGVFYCDTFLYIPAFLRIMGFPVGTAYLLYKFLINVGTVVIACGSFGRIFRDRRIGLFAAALYTLNIYRLVTLYLKDHMGQYTAAMFLPLFAFSVWRLLTEDVRSREYKKVWIPLLLSVTGLIQSHVLTCEITALFSLLTGMVFYKKVLRRETLLEIGKAFSGIILLNSWFLVPFLDYMMTQKLVITGQQVYTRSIQGYGSLLPQLFGVFGLSGSGDLDVSGGMQGEIPFTLGAGLLIGLFYYGYLCLTGRIRRQEKGPFRSLGIYSAVLSALSLFMATVYFPWDRLQGLGGLMAKGISALQYPTRMYTAAAVFLSLTGGCLLWMEKGSGRRKSLWLYVGITLTTLFLVAEMFFSGLLADSPFYKIYEESAFGNSYLSGREYLPLGTDESLLKAGQVVCPETVLVQDFRKDYGGIELLCANNGGDGYVELPLLYYRGYQARDRETGELLRVTDGENHVVRVELPAGYRGVIRTSFVSPWYWRASEAVSLAAWAIFLLYGAGEWNRRGAEPRKGSYIRRLRAGSEQ